MTTNNNDPLKQFVDNLRRENVVLDKRTQQAYYAPEFSDLNRPVGNLVDDINKYDEGLRIGIDQNVNRSYNQGAFRKIRNSFGQLLTGAGAEATNTLGALLAVFDDSYDRGEMSSAVQGLFNMADEIREAGEEFAPVYSHEDSVFDPTSADWWAKSVTNFGPTIGMMIGSMGIGGLAKLGTKALTSTVKAGLKEAMKMNANKAIKRQINKLASESMRKQMGKIPMGKVAELSEIATMSAISRNAESLMAAEDVYQRTLQRQAELHPEYTEEELKKIAGQAASDVYNKGLWLAALDFVQFSSIAKAFNIKGALSPKMQKNIIVRSALALSEPLTEALEESAQFTIEKQVEDQLYAFDNDNNLVETFFDSLDEKEMQESLVQGFLGGAVFKGVGSLMKRLYKNADAQDKKKQDDKNEDQETEDVDFTEVPPNNKQADFDLMDSQSQEPSDADIELADSIAKRNDLNALDLEESAGEFLSQAEMDLADSQQQTPQLTPAEEEFLNSSTTLFEPTDKEIEAAKGPVEDTSILDDVTDPSALAFADTMSDPDAVDAMMGFDENLDEQIEALPKDRQELYKLYLKRDNAQLVEAWSEQKALNKAVHGKDNDAAAAKVMTLAINNSRKLSKEQKQEWNKPYEKVLEETSFTKNNINNYENMYNTAKALVNNKIAQQNVDKLPAKTEVNDIDTFSNEGLLKLSKANLSPEGKQLLQQEVSRRIANNERDPMLKRAITNLTNGKLDESFEALLSEFDEQTNNDAKLVLRELTKELGRDISVVKGDTTSYDPDTNVLTYDNKGTYYDIIAAIAQNLPADKANRLASYIKNLVPEYKDLNNADLIESVLVNPNVVNNLMNTATESNNSPMIKLRAILNKLMQLLGLNNLNGYERIIYEIEEMLRTKPEAKQEPNTVYISPFAKGTAEAIDAGTHTNIVSPHVMYQYDESRNQIYHRNNKNIKDSYYDIQTDSHGDYIMYNNKKHYMSPGYKSGERGVFLDENDQFIFSDFYKSIAQVYGVNLDDLKLDIKPGTLLDVRVPQQQFNRTTNKMKKLGSSHKADFFDVLLFNGDKFAGVLPGNFLKNTIDAAGNKVKAKSPVLGSLRQMIKNAAIENKPLPQLEFKGSVSPLVRTNQKYNWEEVLPQNILESGNYKIGVITEISELTKDPSKGLFPGARIIQYSDTDFEKFNGQSDYLGDPIINTSTPKGNLRIKGDRILFTDSEKYQNKLFQAFSNSAPEERQDKLRNLVRWTGLNTMTNNLQYMPFVIPSDRIVKAYSGTQVSKMPSSQRDGIIMFDANPQFLDWFKSDKEDGWKELAPTLEVYKVKGGSIYSVDPVTFEVGEKVEKVNIKNMLLHPAYNFYQNQEIYKKPVQLDRAKMNNPDYLQEVKDRMQFQVTPKELMSIPDRQIRMVPAGQTKESLLKDTDLKVNVTSIPEPIDPNFDKELNKKIQEILQRLYPEIKLDITATPNFEQESDTVFNQASTRNLSLFNRRKQIFIKAKERQFGLRNQDGSRKRYLKKNYKSTLEIVKKLNRANEDFKFSIITVMGEKGDSRVYNAIKAELRPQNNDKIINQWIKSGDNAKDVLNNVARSDHRYAPLAKILSSLSLQNTPVRIVNDQTFLGRHTSNEILISRTGFFNLKTKGDIVPTFLHEVIHTLTTRTLEDPTNPLTREFNKIYEEALKSKDSFRSTYPFTNIKEFMTGIFTDEKFISDLQTLRSINTRYSNLWKELLDWFNSLIGLNDSLHKDAISVATNILQHQYIENKSLNNYDQNIPRNVDNDLAITELVDEEAANILEKYLSNFGITVQDINKLKGDNLDAIGVADILSKIAYIKDRKDLPPVAGKFIAYMMQYNPLVSDIVKELASKKGEYKQEHSAIYFVGSGLGKSTLVKQNPGKFKDMDNLIKQAVNKVFPKQKFSQKEASELIWINKDIQKELKTLIEKYKNSHIILSPINKFKLKNLGYSYTKYYTAANSKRVINDIANRSQDSYNITEEQYNDLYVNPYKDEKNLVSLEGYISDEFKELKGNNITEFGIDYFTIDNYKDLNKDPYLEEVGKLIASGLKNTLSKSNNFYDRIIKIIKDFFNSDIKTNVELIQKNINRIVEGVINQDADMITASKFKPGAPGKKVNKVSIEKALAQDSFGKSIIKKLSKHQFILTGSTALSEQGTVFRPDENPLHDIDWVSPYKRKKSIALFKKEYPNAVKIRDIVNDDYTTDTYLIVPDGFSIANMNKQDYNGRIVVNSYDIKDSEGNIVGTYRFEKPKGSIKKSEIVTGVEGKLIDFFSYEDTSLVMKPFKFMTSEGWGMNLADWKSTFQAKLNFARIKDIWDYNRFIPNENVQNQKDDKGKVIGQANIEAGTVLIDLINQKQDTLPHEYAHHYIAMFRDAPIVKEAIKKWGSEEALVQSIGEQVVKQKGEAYNWWKKFVDWINDAFTSLTALQKEELTEILTDAFLTRQDLKPLSYMKMSIWATDPNFKMADPNENTQNQDTTNPKNVTSSAGAASTSKNLRKLKKKLPKSKTEINKDINNGEVDNNC
jgi:hypothetical protein